MFFVPHGRKQKPLPIPRPIVGKINSNNPPPKLQLLATVLHPWVTSKVPLIHFTIKFHNFTNGKGRVVNMAAEEDRMDDFIQKDFFKGFTYREICMFLERNHDCVVSITTLKRKVKQLGLRRRMPCYNIDAIRRKNSRNVGWPCNISRGGREFTQLDCSLCTRELIHT